MKIKNSLFSRVMIAGTYAGKEWHYKDAPDVKNGLFFEMEDDSISLAEFWWKEGEGKQNEKRYEFLPAELKNEYDKNLLLGVKHNDILINEVYYVDLDGTLLLNEGLSFKEEMSFFMPKTSIHYFRAIISVVNNYDVWFLKDVTNYSKRFNELKRILDGEHWLGYKNDLKIPEEGCVFECDLQINCIVYHDYEGGIEYDQEVYLSNFEKIV